MQAQVEIEMEGVKKTLSLKSIKHGKMDELRLLILPKTIRNDVAIEATPQNMTNYNNLFVLAALDAAQAGQMTIEQLSNMEDVEFQKLIAKATEVNTLSTSKEKN